MKSMQVWVYGLAMGCLWLSGMAALVYQVVWARYLALLLGHTSYAVVAVLVAFMGGLALGNAWLGRWGDRVRRPLAMYGWLELGITLYAALFPLYFGLCERMYLALARGAEPGSPGLLVWKYVLSLLVILIPTTLMGGTLPVLTRLLTRRLEDLRSRVGDLYFINSLGAVAGVLVADFWWIPAWGLLGALWGGAVLNGVVAVVSLLASRRWESGEEVRVPEVTVKEGTGGGGTEGEWYTSYEVRLAVVAAGVSGFVAMLYEVAWTRVLALSLGSSTHAFSIMLATFIGGIATGAWVVGRWRGLRRSLTAFGWAELALAVGMLVSLWGYHLLPYLFAQLGLLLARTPENHGWYQVLQFLVCAGVMFGPALCLGMTLPLASRAATSDVARTGRSVGVVFSVNTVGTVAGAALTGLVLMPWLGLARTFAVGVVLNLVVALAVLLRGWRLGRWGLLVGWPLVTWMAVVGVGGSLGDTWDRAFALGLWRVSPPPGSVREYMERVEQVDLRYHRDGASATVAVHAWKNAATGETDLTLRVNGKPDATTRGDLPTQLLLAHLPLLLKPESQDVLIVGLGSGVTCGSALTHPGIRKVDVVEISPEVREVAGTLFAPYNGRALEDPRVRVVVDDAKSFLRMTDQQYDVLISEPSNPWMAGVAGVFSEEFYETCRASLRPGGLMVQWVQLYESSEEVMETVAATFRSVFPAFSIWQTLPGDLVLIGSEAPRAWDLEAMRERLAVPAVQADLERVDLHRLPVVLGLQWASEFTAPFLVPLEAPRHSDVRPRLEYLAARAFFTRNYASWPGVWDEAQSRRPTTLLGVALQTEGLSAVDIQAMALFHTAHRLPAGRWVRSAVERWRELEPDSLLAAEYSSRLEPAVPAALAEARRLEGQREGWLAAPGEHLEGLRLDAQLRLSGYRALRSVYYQPPVDELRRVLERLVEVDHEEVGVHRLRLAELAWDMGDDASFIRWATAGLVPSTDEVRVGQFDRDPQVPGEVLVRMIETLWRVGRHEDAQHWGRLAQEGGYVEPGGPYYHPRLEMVIRRVEITLAD